MDETHTGRKAVSFETGPDQYRHLGVEIQGSVASILLDVQEDQGLIPGYKLKLNSYDLGVDIELADAVHRLCFEHPEVACVVITSSREGIFSAGANIFMLGSSTHAFKVNFCKFTNETRLAIEDSSENGGQRYIAALNGPCSGGGYELALACEEIYLVDDRKSAVSLPEVPYLGVLPGTGGLTRVVDKRKVRRDRADLFCTLAEGVKGGRALEWGLVDGIWPRSDFEAKVLDRAREVAGNGHPERRGVPLRTIAPEVRENGLRYRHLDLGFGPMARTATIEIRVPEEIPEIPERASDLGGDWIPFRLFRELDDAILRLRFNHPETGLVLFKTRGDPETLLELDGQMVSRKGDWFVGAVLHFIKRTLKRIDLSAKSFFSLIDRGSCFSGTLFELALASDRAYMLDDGNARIGISELNGGGFPMGTGTSRLETRFLGDPRRAKEIMDRRGIFDARSADELGLVTFALDDLDWEDEVRLAIEERASLSPDSLTGLEANLRFAGKETLETKIFGRLSAWQNWIFQRPNAVGERGALTLYGQPLSPEFDWNRT